MATLLIKNGRVMDPASGRDEIADVLIEDGKIRGAGKDLAVSEVSELFDATGLVVAPGFIDMHVHLREPGFEHAETIETGSRAAAAGGFTSICPMPNTAPVNDNATVTSYIVEKARRHAIVNVFPIGAITKGSKGDALAEIGSMREAGAVAISDDGRPVMNARVMRRAMEFARSFGMPVIDHCEDLHLSAGGDMHEGAESVRLGLRGIPACSEDVMVARDILLAEVTGARYHVAHISSRHSVEMVAFAKARGLAVSAEATPHHLALSDRDMPPYDSNYKMKPPLRSSCDVEAVTQGVVSGAIDAIATDHAPHPGSEKMQEFENCPFGIIGLETALGIALEKLVHPGKIELMRMVELFTTGPGRILSIGRGTLAPGAPADVTIFSVNREWTYDVTKSLSKSSNSPFHNKTFRGGPVATVVGGQIVWRCP
ncbi:MAG: dihydroorotase [Bryobacterales bacterium]|nr:dihydroorotase [Bryobacterales bacterium]MBV9399489.1 dihydroorotase [Bryobacterales bacterium]